MLALKKAQSQVRSIAVGAVALFVFLTLNGLIVLTHVYAAGNVTGPTQSWFGGSTAYYTLENDSQVKGAQSVTIPLYVDNGSSTNAPTNVSVKSANSNSGNATSMGKACLMLSAGGSCACNMDCTMSVPARQWVYDNTLQMWTTNIGAKLTGSPNGNGQNVRYFQLSVTSGTTIGYLATKQANDKSFAVSQKYGTGKSYSYTIPFGSDCSVQSQTSASIFIYDGDVGNAAIQPVPFEVKITDTTTNTDLVDDKYTTAAQASAAGLGNNSTAEYKFNVQPNHHYALILNKVYSDNTLQFQLPYSSIYSQVTCNYSLTPTVSVSALTAQAGDSVTVMPSVNNTGQVNSVNTQWQLSQFSVPPGRAVPGAGSSPRAAPAYYGYPVTVLGSGTGQSYPVGVTNLANALATIGDEPVGTKVCFGLSVKAHSNTDNNWEYSVPACVTVAKEPKTQVWGGDLSVAGNVVTSISDINNLYYGSWGEYGAVVSGQATGFGTAAAFNGGLTNYSACNVSQLIFTNAGNSSCTNSTSIGGYRSTQPVPDVAAAFPLTSTTPSFGGLGDAQYTRTETASGTVNIGGGTIQKGQWLVLNAPNATVNITGNITYTTARLSGIADIPQLVIIANCINITGGVQQVDAWLVASGTGGNCANTTSSGVINTCSDVIPGGNLSSTVCGSPLQVNGPVIANHLYLQRTAGGDKGAENNPAELFDLRPDAYMWLAQRSYTSGYIQATSTVELPPRY